MLDQKSLEIISHLRKNSRKPLTKIAEEIKTPITTTHDYYKRLGRYFEKHTSIIDFSKIGYKIRSFLIINNSNNKNIDNFLLSHNQINNIYRLHKERMAIDIIFNNMQNQSEFLEKLEELNIEIIDEYKIIEELKIEDFDPIKHNNIKQQKNI